MRHLLRSLPRTRNLRIIRKHRSIVRRLYNKTMKSPIVTLTPEELFSISLEIRNRIKDAVSNKRIMPTDVNTLDMDNSQIESFVLQSHTDPEVLIGHVTPLLPEEGAIVVQDPYEVYLRNVAQGQTPEIITVAKESHALRSIEVIVDGREKVEYIVDTGSQIVAMSESLCHDLGLP